MQVEEIGDVCVGRIEGPKIMRDQPFGDELSGIDNGSRKIVLDFRDVNFLSAAVWGKLVKAAYTRRGKAPQLHLLNLDEHLMLCLRIIKVENMFTLCTDENEAIESLNKVTREACPDCDGTSTDKACRTCGGHGTIWR